MTIKVDEIAAVLQRGGIVLMPTDTIYGLHALANDPRAIERLTEIKGRDETKPFIVIGASREQLEQSGATFTQRARAAVSELWPGPLTAIVPLRKTVAASRGSTSIGVRVPALQWLRDLLMQTGPLASTSVNRSGEPPMTDPKSLSLELQSQINLTVDEGLKAGEASAIVDFTGDEPRFIREGDSFFTQKVWKTLRKSL
ncbi:MAG TPA: L-threonylcarbamoyladenylate synthase [Thermoanaerobaculia bacterium]|nr:L-threonylcarbamoyladenylate synthase [Thermoanaerobaculia bacterium]